MPQPLSPDPVRDYRPEYVPAYLANGLVGLRCGRIPWRDGTAMVNGFAGLDVVDGLEGFARVPFPLAADVAINRVRISGAQHLVRFIEQRYDFGMAELTTILEFTVDDVTARVEVVQLCSHTQPTVVLQELRVSVDRAADLSIAVGVDPSGVPGSAEFRDKPSGKDTDERPDGLLVWTGPGAISDCGIAYWSEDRRHDRCRAIGPAREGRAGDDVDDLYVSAAGGIGRTASGT